MEVTGGATLDGDLGLDVSGSYAPASGEFLDVITWGSLSGAFDEILGTELGGGLFFEPQYLASSLRLLVSP